MDSNFLLDAAVHLMLLVGAPYLAVQAFRLVRDDCSRTPPRSSVTSPDILGDIS